MNTFCPPLSSTSKKETVLVLKTLTAAHALNQVDEDTCLSSLSTFGLGGKIRYYIAVSTEEQLIATALCAQNLNLPFLIIGNGSNCLFADKGFNGLIIHNKIDLTSMEGNFLSTGAGTQIATLGVKTAKEGYGGLEFSAGVPGTVGGAIYMNAGCMGQQTLDNIASVKVLGENGEVFFLNKKELEEEYRTSIFQKKGWIVLSATFALYEDPSARERQKKMIEYRRKTQPYQEKSAGCVFRNPPNMSAGFLIEQAGLKGTQLGGAMISNIHANFIINTGMATAEQVRSLIKIVQSRVFEMSGITLQSEICIFDE